MSAPVYYPIEGDVLPHLFGSYDSNGASVTLTGLAVTDIEIYKDGGTTQRASDNGYTLLDTDGIDFDLTTGVHGFSVDLSDNSDAGFYSVGPWYHVVVSSVTISTQTVTFVAFSFRIVSATRGLAGTALPAAAAEAAGGLYTRGTGAGQINQPANGMIDVNVENWNATAVPAEHTAGYPIVTIKDGTGTGEINTNAGAVALVDLVTTTTTLTNAVTLANGAHGGAAAVITAERIVVASTTTNQPAVKLTGDGTGAGLQSTGGATGHGLEVNGGASGGDGFHAHASLGNGIEAEAHGSNGHGMYLQGDGSGSGLRSVGGATGHGINGLGGATSGAGINGQAQTDGDGMQLTGAGTGVDLDADITGNITGNVTGSVGSVTGAVGSVTGAVGSVTGAVGSVTGNVTGSVGSLATQAKADVNAEVVDALATDTYAEPGQGTPAATTTLAAKINYLYKMWRNRKTQTSTVWSLYNDDATTVDQKATVADDGTTSSKTEIATGP